MEINVNKAEMAREKGCRTGHKGKDSAWPKYAPSSTIVVRYDRPKVQIVSIMSSPVDPSDTG